MKNRRRVNIIPESKENTLDGRFHVFDTEGRRFTCYNMNLFDVIIPGHVITLELRAGRTRTFNRIIGGTKPVNNIEQRTYKSPGVSHQFNVARLPIKTGNRPKNKTEAWFYDRMRANGWKVTKRGWPDFACWKDGKFVVVEVKNSKSDKLKSEQVRIMRVLAGFGITCYRWSGDAGFQAIHENTETI